jgi:hypothetical protein
MYAFEIIFQFATVIHSVNTSLKISHWEGQYIDRTLVQSQWKVPVWIMKVRNWNHVLTEGTTLDHCEPVRWAAPINCFEPQAPVPNSVSHCWVSGVMPNLNGLEKPRHWRCQSLNSRMILQWTVKLLSGRAWNFKLWLLKEVLRCLGICKTQVAHLDPQS